MPDSLDGVRVFSVLGHMHLLGTSVEAIVNRGGEYHAIQSRDPYDFHGQAWVPSDYAFAKGDTVTTTCRWKNATDHSVGQGLKTTDEMCYSLALVYPARTGGAHWPIGDATCVTSQAR